MLKIFPAKSSSQNVANLKKEIDKEISEIKQAQKILRVENPMPFAGLEQKNRGLVDDNILGDLLFYLRTEKIMSTLMICRQIEKIEIEDSCAYLDSESYDLSELVNNEKHKAQLDIFFKSKGLGFKLKEKIKEFDPIDSLREFFGDKLKIK